MGVPTKMSRLSIIALVFAIAAPCVLSYSSGYSSGSASATAAAGSSYTSAGAGGNVASASASASAAAKKITLIKQTVTLTGGVSAYTGDVKDVYEKGYGKAIGIYDTTKKAYTKGCSVASTASTRRADIKVAFVASIDQSQAGFGATSAAQI